MKRGGKGGKERGARLGKGTGGKGRGKKNSERSLSSKFATTPLKISPHWTMMMMICNDLMCT